MTTNDKQNLEEYAIRQREKKLDAREEREQYEAWQRLPWIRRHVGEVVLVLVIIAVILKAIL